MAKKKALTETEYRKLPKEKIKEDIRMLEVFQIAAVPREQKRLQKEIDKRKLILANKKEKKKRLTLFQKPTYKKYSKIISFKNPTEARKSSKKLEEEFANSKTNAKKLRIARVAQYSANRAKATVKRKNLSRAEKSEYRKISTIYDNSANLFFKEYNYYKNKKIKKRK